MLKCTICNHSGANMKRCKKCGQIYCRSCADKGKINGKRTAQNKCPYCGALNQSEPAR